MKFIGDPHSLLFWVVWAVFIIWENYALTFVGRARNSASLKRHLFAVLQLNAAWFAQMLFIFAAFKNIIDGKYGWEMTLLALLYYTALAVAASIYAHYRSLKKESGLTAVGASKKYAQIPVEEWERVLAAVIASENEKG